MPNDAAHVEFENGITDVVDLRYNGWRYDVESRLYFVGNQPYDANSGRLLTENTSVQPGQNRYTLGGNSPDQNRSGASSFGGGNYVGPGYWEDFKYFANPQNNINDGNYLLGGIQYAALAVAAVAGTAAAVLAAPAAGAAIATYAATFSSAGFAAYVGKNIVVAALETGVESKIAGWTGDDSFSLVGSFGRNLAFNLTVGLLPGAAESKLAAKATVAAAKVATSVGVKGAARAAVRAGTKYAIHYSSEVAVGTAFDTAWEAGVNGRPIGAAFTQSIVGNSIGQLVGDGLSAGLRKGLQAAGIKQFGRLCFVAGTIVIRGDGSQQAIEQIELGSKVQPRDVNYVETNEPDAATWRKITLRAMNAEDADVEIELLRPLSWLESQRATAGSVIHVEIAELNLDGKARVLNIEPCTPIQPGPGAVVTGRFTHVSDDLVDVWIEGLEEPVTGTSRHPFWSVTRQGWVPASKLLTGELLETRTGITAQIVSVGLRDGVQPVYNLEVGNKHEYRAGRSGILVHNSSFSEGSELPALPEFDGTTKGYLVVDGKVIKDLESGPRTGARFPFSQADGHLETTAALYMKENNIIEATVYHNNPKGTCGNCDYFLPTFLEKDSIMNVVPPANAVAPTPRWKDKPTSYRGNSNSPY